MDTILASVEEILAGIELDAADVPVSDIPDYLPRMCSGRQRWRRHLVVLTEPTPDLGSGSPPLTRSFQSLG